MNKPAKAFSFIFWSVGTGFYLTAVLSDYWWDHGKLDSSYGLFKQCQRVWRDCRDLGWNISKKSKLFLPIFIPRILMLIGGVVITIGIIFDVIGLWLHKNCPLYAEGYIQILAGMVIFAACSFFMGFNYSPLYYTSKPTVLPPDSGFGYSLYAAWTSGTLYMIGGLCSLFAARKMF